MHAIVNISIYITSYNQKAYLIEAIESVLGQTLPPFQVIIVDDCSTDGSQAVIAGHASKQPDLITPIYHQSRQGVARTRIDALNAVRGDYVTYVDGDDRYLPTKLEKEAGLLAASPGAQIAFSNSYYISSEGERIGVWAESRPPQGDVFQQTFSRAFPKRNVFRMELVKYSSWKALGFHDPELRILEDLDMRIRLAKHFRVVYYDEPLSEIRLHGTGLSNADASEKLATLERILRKNVHLLHDLEPAARTATLRHLRGYLAHVALTAAEEELDRGEGTMVARATALFYWLRCLALSPDQVKAGVALKALLPNAAFEVLRTTVRDIRAIHRAPRRGR